MSMYDASDPRSALNAPAKTGTQPASEFAAAEYAKFYETVPLVKMGDMFQLDGASKTVKGYKVFFLRRFWNVSK